jgi:UTP:GlnB (protein PII) uridylyltransferase
VATLGHEVVDVFYVQQPGHDGVALQIEASLHDDLRHDLKDALVEH